MILLDFLGLAIVTVVFIIVGWWIAERIMELRG